MTLRLIGAVVTLALPACASYQRAAGISTSNPSVIQVVSRLSPDSLQAMAFGAAVRAGFWVSDQRQGIVTIGPYALPKDAGVKLALHMAFIPDSGGSIAVVSGVVTADAYGSAIAGLVSGTQGRAMMEGIPIRQATTGRNARNWSELERLAGVVRQALSDAQAARD